MRRSRQSLPYVCMAAAMMAATSCGSRVAAVDPQTEAQTPPIRAIDHHAHPVRFTAKGEAPDRGFDALPVDNMEPMSDPLIMRPGAAQVKDAAQALYGGQ